MTNFAFVCRLKFAEAEKTWQFVLKDRKKRKSANSVTVYCDRVAKMYSKHPPKHPAFPKPSQKMRLLDRVKTKHPSDRPLPLPPLVPNFISRHCSPLPGENGVKQHCKVIDISDDYEDDEETDDSKSRWKGIEDVLIAYRDYMKGLFVHLCYYCLDRMFIIAYKVSERYLLQF